MRKPSAISLLLLTLLVAPPPAAADGVAKSIAGTVSVAPALARHIGARDRLIIKLYHPAGGIEKDTKYRILAPFTLPLAFHIAPTIDMNARTRFESYMVEVFTDKNRDVLAIAEGELIGRTAAAVPLGTTGLAITLDRLRE